MMELLWNDILNRFGQNVILSNKEGDIAVKALVQPLLDRAEDQEISGPLGWGRQERFRYFGPARYPLDLNTVVEWKGRDYRVQSAHLAGEGVCPHCWAVLYPREEAPQ